MLIFLKLFNLIHYQLYHFVLFITCFRYIPTRLWGFSGHVQTIVHSIIGRVRCPWPIGERNYLSLSDGTTLTYDLYQPIDQSHDGTLFLL